jgi:riboflavin kinase/FMN adenylyltransferase
MIEVNIFDFNKEIYGIELRVHVKKFMRPEIKFHGLDELRDQIARDKQDVLALFGH